jgi:hypothetical protein
MGMDLLNESSAAPTQVNKVDNLNLATSPKGLGTGCEFKDLKIITKPEESK